MNSISKKLIEDDKKLREDIKDCIACRNCVNTDRLCFRHETRWNNIDREIKGVAETCEAILKNNNFVIKGRLYSWLESEIKTLKEGEAGMMDNITDEQIRELLRRNEKLGYITVHQWRNTVDDIRMFLMSI